MNYARIKYPDVSNGEGCRISLFVSGCRLGCKGCFNKKAQNFQYGEPYTKDTENEILEKLGEPYITGLSFLGGDPLEPENQKDVSELIIKAKKLYPEKDVWLWTGRTYPKVPITKYTKSIIENIDVLIDGAFIEELKDLTLEWRGSSNQKIIRKPDSNLLEAYCES